MKLGDRLRWRFVATPSGKSLRAVKGLEILSQFYVRVPLEAYREGAKLGGIRSDDASPATSIKMPESHKRIWRTDFLIVWLVCAANVQFSEFALQMRASKVTWADTSARKVFRAYQLGGASCRNARGCLM